MRSRKFSSFSFFNDKYMLFVFTIVVITFLVVAIVFIVILFTIFFCHNILHLHFFSGYSISKKSKLMQRKEKHFKFLVFCSFLRYNVASFKNSRKSVRTILSSVERGIRWKKILLLE